MRYNQSWLTQDLVCTAEWFRRYREPSTLFFKCDSRTFTLLLWGVSSVLPLWLYTILGPCAHLSLWLLNKEMASARASFSRMKKSLLCLTPGWFHLTRYLFFSKYFFSTLESIISSWSCIKQHSPQGRLVSLFGQPWKVWTDIFPKCLTWISICLLDTQGTCFPFQTSY